MCESFIQTRAPKFSPIEASILRFFVDFFTFSLKISAIQVVRTSFLKISTDFYQIKKDNTQVVRAQGPTNDSAQLQLTFRDNSLMKKKDYQLELKVSYYVRKQSKQPLYLWQPKNHSNHDCSLPCGGGVVSIAPVCLHMQTRGVVAGSKCSSKFALPTAVTRPCNTHACAIRYDLVPGPWGKCDVCNKAGHQTRELTCVRNEEGRAARNVDERFCVNVAKPVTKRDCYVKCARKRRKCYERQKRCPDMKAKGYCKYKSDRLLCCRTCNENAHDTGVNKVSVIGPVMKTPNMRA